MVVVDLKSERHKCDEIHRKNSQKKFTEYIHTMRFVQQAPPTTIQPSLGKRRHVMARASKKEPIAAKYCFSARCVLRPNALSDASIALVFGYDKRPSVSTDVSSVASIFCKETGYVQGDVELLMHSECPVEVTNEIIVALFNDPLDGEPSLETMHDIAIKQNVRVTKPSILESRSSNDDHNDDHDDHNDDDDTPNGPNGPDSSPDNDDGSGGGGGGGGSLPRTPQPQGPSGGMELALPV